MTDVDDWTDPGDNWVPEPDFDAIDYREHCLEVHGGRACDCPLPSPEETEAAWAERMREHREQGHGGKACDCEPPF